MTREEIISMAREAGLGTALCHNSIDGDRIWIEGADWHDEVERFAKLVAIKAAASEREWMQETNIKLIAEAVSAEREACAIVCDERERANLYGLKECAALIRERGVK